jgi:CheY-like chemotaxis protein
MGKKILYIEDEPYFINSLIDALSEEGYSVDQAYNGTHAIEKLVDSTPDLIILDIIMPTGAKVSDPEGGRRTGVKTYEIIRGEKGLKVPIIFVTVVEDPDTHRKIKQLEKMYGIDRLAILVKPVLPTELVDQVRLLIGGP